MAPYRIGIFGRETSPLDGGADTLLRMLREKIPAQLAGGQIELVSVPWAAWSHRRRPLRYLWCRAVRWWGGEIPLVDVRPLCRRLGLSAAYFAAPAYARIDVPYVFTLWDLGHRTIPEFPEMRSGRDPWSHREAMYRTMLGQASYVVTGNQAGAAEAREFYGVGADKLVPLPFPNPDFSAVAEEVPVWLPKVPFFVYPAQFWAHKNHHTLLRALALMSGRDGEAPHLVFTGSDKGNAAYLRDCAAALGVAERVHFAGFVSRGVLKALYQRATGLVFPSLLGPNNLPPQEAAVLNCPMVLSDLVGHREQLGTGALYAAALDPQAWAEAMMRLRDDPALCEHLRRQARAAVAGYTLESYVAGLSPLLARLIACRQLSA